MATADQATLDEIKRLSGALLHAQAPPRYSHKHTHSVPAPSYHPYSSYKPTRGRGRGGHTAFVPAPQQVQINGETFKTSKYKLQRQTSPTVSGLNRPPPSLPPFQLAPRASYYKPTPTHPAHRSYKSKTRRPGAGSVSKVFNKKPSKPKSNKQCPFFSRTGMCARAKNCPYQHDSEKTAICPRFMAHDCTDSASTCLLSHESTLNRVAPCLHFHKTGICKNGDKCLYPHVRMGPKSGVCRDFAVLGYCDKGGACEMEHVRECPDFAEKGVCETRTCKLPHVIRANRKQGLLTVSSTVPPAAVEVAPAAADVTEPLQAPKNGTTYTFESGDDFIPVTFLESDEETEEVEGTEDRDEEEDGSDDDDDDGDDDMDDL